MNRIGAHTSEPGTFPDMISRPESLRDIVYTAIRAAIVGKRLEPGARVTAVGIAEQLGVSKTPVREAMLRLQEVGLIEPDEGRGARVVRFSPVAFTQALEMREVLEGYVAEKAARVRTEDCAQRIVDAARRSLVEARAGDIAAYHAANADFHQAIAATTDNERITAQIDAAADLLRAIRERDFPSAEAVVDSALDHVAIAEAILDGDAVEAGGRMRAHIRQVKDYFFHESEKAAPGSLR